MKLKRILVALLACLSVVFGALGFAACDLGGIINPPKPLSAPTGLRIENGALEWNPVEYSIGYTVSIDGKEYTDTDTVYPLDGVADGEHVFKVKANGDGVLYVSSAFSEQLKETIQGGAKVSMGYYGQFDELTKKESFLGYGFDVIKSAVFSDKYVKTSFTIFDTDELMNQRLLKVDSKQSYVEEIQSESMETFMSEWNVSTNVNVGWGSKHIGGSVEVSAKYSGGLETAKSKYYHVISINNQQFYIVMQSDIATYRDIVSEGFKADLYSDLEPAQLFDRYGTHFITSAVMGGKINSYYLYSSEEEKKYHDVSAKVSVEVRGVGSNQTNVDVSGGYRQEAAKQNIYIENTLEVIGGGDFGMLSDEDLPKNYAAWEQSLNNHASLMGIKDTSSLIPIWELIDASLDTRVYEWNYPYKDDYGNLQYITGTGTRAQQLQAYFEAYGVDAYNDLMVSSGLPEISTPEEIVDIKVNNKSSLNGEYEVLAGVDNDLSFTVLPADATGYTKNASLSTSNEYAEIKNDNGLKLVLKPDINHDEVLQIVLSAGSIRETITVRVVKKYTVTFNSNGGTAIEPIKDVVHGSQIDEPTAPTKEGYIFDGWYTNNNFVEGTEYKFGNQAIEGYLTLYAKWVEYRPTVTFVHNIEEIETSKVEIKYATAVVPDFATYGYTLEGYYADEEFATAFDIQTTIKKDTTIYVKWQPNVYTVTFNSNGGTPVEEQKVAYKSKVERPTVAKTGYVSVDGWCTDVELTNFFDFSSDVVTKDITLYAKWSNVAKTLVAFNSNGGSAHDSIPVEYGKSLGENMPTPEREGYTFKGWFFETEFVTQVFSITTFGELEMVTLYAKWEVNTYNVIFNSNGGVGTMNMVGPVAYGGYFDLPKNLFERVGYTFEGWSFDKNAVVSDFVDEEEVCNLTTKKEDVVLYAVWGANRYIVKYNANGGSGTMNNQSCVYEKSVALSANKFTKAAYEFIGWNTKADGTGTSYKDKQSVKNLTSIPNAEVTLYAQWEKIVYKIILNPNVDGAELLTQSVEYGEDFIFPNYIGEKTGYTFIGWECDEKVYYKAEKITPTASMTFYAKWARILNQNFNTSQKVNDNGYWGLSKSYQDKLDLSEFKGYFKEGFKVVFSIAVDFSTTNDGYAQLFLYNQDNSGKGITHDASEKLKLAQVKSAYGLVKYNTTTTCEDGYGFKNDKSYTMKYDWTVEAENCAESMYLRYDAFGNGEDSWTKLAVRVTITLVKE